jgi:hypothetical protein
MIIEKKENYLLISSNENSFKEFYASFLETKKDVTNEHIIIKISETLNCTNTNLVSFLNFATQKKQNGTSFVVVYKNVDVDDFPENFNIVPTLQEAEDIIEMEVIERALGF